MAKLGVSQPLAIAGDRNWRDVGGSAGSGSASRSDSGRGSGLADSDAESSRIQTFDSEDDVGYLYTFANYSNGDAHAVAAVMDVTIRVTS